MGKGYIGVGVDEYGNYSTNLEGKSGPVSTLVPSSIVVRGPGDGIDPNANYMYKAGVACAAGGPHAASSFLGFNKRYPDSSDVHYRRVKFILTPGSSLSASDGYTLTVIMFRGSGTVGTPAIGDTLISNLDYPYIAPKFLRYGLAGSTGGATDVHEIRSVIIRPTTIAALQPPTLSNDEVAEAYGNQTTLIDITANDKSNNHDGSIDKTTIDLDPATAGLQNTFTVAGKGSFYLNADGTVSFVPAWGYTGTCTMVYTASDNYGLQAITPATISVSIKTGTPPSLVISNPPSICTGATIDITSSAWKTETTPNATYSYFATLTDANANTNNINATATAISTSGTYYVRATLNGSYTVQPIVVQIYPKPSAASAGNEQSFCTTPGSDNTTTLLGNTPTVGTGKWSLVSGPDNDAVIMLPYSPSAVVQNLHVGTYTFKWTITSGPCDSSSATVKVNFYAVATTAVTPTSRALCNSTADTLKGNTPVYGIGSWTQTSGPTVTIESANQPTAYVRNLTPGSSYTFKYTIANGICKSWSFYTDSSLVNTTAYAGADQNIYVNHTQLNANIPDAGNTGKWTLVSGPQGNTATITDPSSPTSTITGFNNYGKYVFQWTISNGSCSTNSRVNINFAGVLPVNFIAFDVVPSTSTATLNWQVANANNMVRYIVERSADGVHFTSAGNIASSSSSNKYTYTDDIHNLVATNVYYRIAGISADGGAIYSGIISMPLMNTSGGKVYAWPNPFKNGVNVTVKATEAGKSTLSLYSSHGQLISVVTKQVEQGINQLELKNLASLASGVYILHVQCNGDSYTQKIIKE